MDDSLTEDPDYLDRETVRILKRASEDPGDVRRFLQRLFPEQRIQVKATRFRVPNVCVVAGDKPQEQILSSPPVPLCGDSLEG